jgi:hypothetical protein
VKSRAQPFNKIMAVATNLSFENRNRAGMSTNIAGKVVVIAEASSGLLLAATSRHHPRVHRASRKETRSAGSTELFLPRR